MTTWHISKLHNWEKNPRAINKQDFERLKKQISELGQYKPLLIEPDGNVLGGNMRLRAYQDLGITDVWVSIVEPKTEAERLKFALSDNDRAGYYIEEQLAELLQDFPEIDLENYKVDLKEPIDLKTLLDQFRPVEEDEAPPLPEGEPISKYGEVYQLGRHRLMCGDATKIEDVEKLMDGKKADMVFTDPPYGMNLDTDFSDMVNDLKFVQEKNVKSGKKYNKVLGDNKDFNFLQFEGFEAKEQFWWGADYYCEQLPKSGSWFVWDKRLEETADKMYGSSFELCWSKNKHKREIARIKWAGIFGTEKEFDHKRYHPTQKPIALSEWFIKKFSKENQIILDLFGGSGSTLIACEQTNRTCYMMELDPKYCDVIRLRYNNFIEKTVKEQ